MLDATQEEKINFSSEMEKSATTPLNRQSNQFEMLRMNGNGNFLSTMKQLNADMPKPNNPPSMMSDKFQEHDEGQRLLLKVSQDLSTP